MNNDKIDAVIATLLHPNLDFFGFILDELKKSELINKIIIIDNTEEKTFDKTFEINEKFIILKPRGNIFVNPAWNLGVENVESKYFFILNDDILFTQETINVVYHLFKSKDDIRVLAVQSINSSTNSEFNDEIESYNNFLRGKKENLSLQHFNSRQGYFIMMKKDDWIEIPEDMKIFCGDDFMFDITEYKFPNKKNYITNNPIVYNYSGASISKIKNLYDYFFKDTELLVNKYFPDKPLDFYKNRFYSKHIKK